MSDASQKPCRRCCESIPLGATCCPKCRSWQSLWGYLTGNPQCWLGLVVTLILLVPLWRLWAPGADFGNYCNQVQVLESQMQVARERSFGGLVTIGRLRNNSPVKWKEVVIEVQYFDKDGKLIGTKSERDHNLVLLPGVDHAFQVSSTPEFPPEAYASHKVYVRDARDARKWP